MKAIKSKLQTDAQAWLPRLEAECGSQAAWIMRSLGVTDARIKKWLCFHPMSRAEQVCLLKIATGSGFSMGERACAALNARPLSLPSMY